MKTPFLAAAALVVFAVGVPVTANAAGENLALKTPITRDILKGPNVRQLVVEPKSVAVEPKVLEPKIAVIPEGSVSPDEPKKGGSTIQQIVINPEGTPSGEPDDKVVNIDPVPTRPVEPRPAPSEPVDIADLTPGQPIEPAPIAAPIEPEVEAVAEVPAETIPAPAPAPKATEKSVAGATSLFNILSERGFDVEILKQDADGNYVFYVTEKNGEIATLLLVDGEYGKVLQRREVRIASSYDDGYDGGYSEAPAYSAREDYGDNCETGGGYHSANNY